MKKYIKPILIVFLIIIITFLITGICCHYFISSDNKVSDEDVEIIKDEELTNEKSKSNDDIVEETEVNVDNNEVINTESTTKEEVSPKEEIKNNNSKNSSSSNPDSKNQSDAQTSNEKPTSEENTTLEVENAWDSLGITEYDYYHKPIWNWARVDYSIEEYKTQENARNACIDEGNRLTKGEHIKSGFSCLNVLSYSGDYLGEMLQTF